MQVISKEPSRPYPPPELLLCRACRPYWKVVYVWPGGFVGSERALYNVERGEGREVPSKGAERIAVAGGLEVGNVLVVSYRREEDEAKVQAGRTRALLSWGALLAPDIGVGYWVPLLWS